jgi:DNA-binding response OmpR family regulator/class 3 adenylate cyclase/tetratricopeptide (TPR) repeat protein
LGYVPPGAGGFRMDRMRSRIMVIGRDANQRAQLARLLSAHGYRIEIADGAAHASRIGFKGIALALVVPDGLGPAGRGLIHELRVSVGNALVLDAAGSKGVQSADLIDPMDEVGVLARVAEALKPIDEPETAEPTLEFAGYCLDLSGHCLTNELGNEIQLTHGEFGLLRAFVQRSGRVLSRDQLMRLLAGRDADSYDRSVDMQIVRLRRKIEPDPKHPTLIVTVPGAGYKFTAKVRQAEAVVLAEPAALGSATIPVTVERRHVTVLAAELLAAPGNRLPVDPEELQAIVEHWRRYAGAIVVRYGGVVAGSRLREVLGYFGYPVAQEHAAERALHAALAMARRSRVEDTALPAGLAVRLGVASGLIVADTNGELLGEAPAEASHLLHFAEPAQIIITAATQQLAGDLFTYRDLGPLAAKGVPFPLPAWQVLDTSAVGSRSEALHANARAPLVGREEELSALLRAWRHSAAGEGRLVLLSGEPGIGKSRLLAALEAELAAEPHASLRYFCSPLHQDSALHPIVARWEQEACFAHGDTAEERLHKLEAIIAPEELPFEYVGAIAAMLSVSTGDRHRQPDLTPQQRKELTLRALLHRLEKVAQTHPVLMLFEDAQWADPSSLELLDLLIERLTELPILLAISFRSEYVAPWIGRSGVSVIVLSRLNRRDSEALAEATADCVLGRDLLARIVAQADGVPLFIEELTKAVLEASADCTHRAPWAAADPAIVARDYAEMAARTMGYFERSLAVAEQSMTVALDRGHLFSIVWASVSRIFALRSFGHYAEAIACADRAIDICEKHGFDARIGNVLLHRGPVLFDRGDKERGLADLERGIVLWRKTSGLFMLARNMLMLADYQLQAQQIDRACVSLSEAERLAEATEEKDYLAEIIRLRGRIWQNEGNYEVARQCFEQAIARSRAQRARLFELHAARDLVRLTIETGHHAGAHEELRTVVEWFPADLDIPVLAECRALLQ